MRFFVSSETHKNVGLKLTSHQNIIGDSINHVISSKNYGSISLWGYISIANPKEVYAAGLFKEITRYRKTKNEVEMRLRINYDELLKGDDQEVFDIICKSILRSIDIAEFELKIQNFDFATFRKDVTDIFKRKRWI